MKRLDFLIRIAMLIYLITKIIQAWIYKVTGLKNPAFKLCYPQLYHKEFKMWEILEVVEVILLGYLVLILTKDRK